MVPNPNARLCAYVTPFADLVLFLGHLMVALQRLGSIERLLPRKAEKLVLLGPSGE
jgi:hypothetical protein